MKKALTLLLFGYFLVACSMTSKQSDLDVSLLQYEKGWRWNEIGVVLQFHRVGSYDVASINHYENIRIGDYQVLSSRPLEGGRILQQVSLSYHYRDDVRIKNTTFDVIWGYDSSHKRWYVESNLPIIK